MAKISTYEQESAPQLSDKVIGTSVDGNPENNTANFTFQSILDLFIPEITLQDVVNAGNVVNLAANKSEAMTINMSSAPTVSQKGIKINMPTQTAGSFPNGDCFVAKINGQNPQALTNYVSGFYGIVQGGADNFTFCSEHTATVSSSIHFYGDNASTGTSDFLIFKSNSLLKFKVDYLGNTIANSLTITPSSGDGITVNAGAERGIYCVSTDGTSVHGEDLADGIGVQGDSVDGNGVYGYSYDGIGVYGKTGFEGGAIVADGGSLGTGLTVINGGVNIFGLIHPVTGYQLNLTLNSAAKPSTNTWTIASDERVKTNVNPYTKGLETILAINPITYDYNGKAGFDSASVNNIGIIAQDVLSIIPECISTYKAKLNEDDEEKTELYNFDSHALTFILINAIKELKAEIELLKSK